MQFIVCLLMQPCTSLCAVMQIAEDWRMDPRLFSFCKDSVRSLCKDVEQGYETNCLVRGGRVLRQQQQDEHLVPARGMQNSIWQHCKSKQP